MSQNLRNYVKSVYTLDAVVQRAPQRGWDAASPCDGWTARQVLGHYLWGMKRTIALVNGTEHPAVQAEADVAGSDPNATWAALRDTVLEALDQPGVLDQVVAGPFGDMELDAYLNLPIMDGLLHAWDIATSFGQDAYLPPDLAAVGAAMIASFGDGARRPGLFGPEVEVPADADSVTRFVAAAGRSPRRVG